MKLRTILWTLLGVVAGFCLLVGTWKLVLWQSNVWHANGETWTILYGKDGAPNQYASWDAEIRDWRFIMLPNTSFGFTMMDGDGKELGYTAGKAGHPTTLTDLGVKEPKTSRITLGASGAGPLDDMVVVESVEAPDGNWLISYRFKGSPDKGPDADLPWTVWSPEVMQFYREQGLTQRKTQ